MSNLSVIAIFLAVVCTLASAVGVKDWNQSTTAARIRVVVPAVIALILAAYVVMEFMGFEYASALH